MLRGDALQRIGDAVVERRDRLAAGNRHLVGLLVPIEVAVTLRDLVVGHPVGLAGMMLAKVGILDHLEIAENRTEYLGGLSGPRQAGCVQRVDRAELRACAPSGRGAPQPDGRRAPTDPSTSSVLRGLCRRSRPTRRGVRTRVGSYVRRASLRRPRAGGGCGTRTRRRCACRTPKRSSRPCSSTTAARG